MPLPFYGQSHEPGLWPGTDEDMRDYDAWRAEYAVWEAMMVPPRRDGDPDGQDGSSG